jgi:hypothetical protein
VSPWAVADAPAQRVCKTRRPAIPAEPCTFRFNVCFSNDKNTWFFKKQGGGCTAHIGHCHLHPKPAKASSAALDEDKCELALQQLHQLNIPIASIRALLETRTDTSFTCDQINAIRTKAQLTLVLGDVSSPAEQLMRKLEADTDICYVVHAAHHSVGDLIAFRLSKKDWQGKTDTEVGDKNNVGTDEDRASTFAKLVMEGLSVQGGAVLLLTAAWVTSEGRQCYNMFDEAVVFDTACGTKAETRPLARGTSTISDKQNVPFFNAFLPSQCQSVFNWHFTTAFPTLFPSRSCCQQTELVVTDQDEE